MDYKFDRFKWLANMSGFGYPVDVHYGTVYLGILEVEKDGVVVAGVSTPDSKAVSPVKKTPKNKFKTELDAAKVLHKTWAHYRKNQPPPDDAGEEWKTNTTMKESTIKRLIKSVLREIKESTEPCIGGSYSDQQTSVAGSDVTQLERDPLTDPMLTGKAFIQEYKSIDTKQRAIQTSDPNRGARLLFTWVERGEISYEEFELLMSTFILKNILQKIK